MDVIYGVRFGCRAYHNELDEVVPVTRDPAWLYNSQDASYFIRESTGVCLGEDVTRFGTEEAAKATALRLLKGIPAGLLLTGTFEVVPLVREFVPKFIGYKPAY